MNIPRPRHVKDRGSLRHVKRLLVGFVLLDATASIMLLSLGSLFSQPAIKPSHPRMNARHLEQLLNPRSGRQATAAEGRPLAYRCSVDPSGGWDYICRQDNNEVGYYNVSPTAITKQSVIETHGREVTLVG
jgi:hypothetical protein